MKKIYPKEWLELHPYKQTDSTDLYYTGIANKLYSCLNKSVISDSFDDDDNIRYTSLCLAAWFEDVISQTGIWQAFTTECKKRYGSYLPFYSLDEDYYPDEINLEDIRFLLWHHIQYFRNRDTIVNPENPGIELVAYDLYTILADEYETAPENRRMQEYLFDPFIGDESFFQYRGVLEWFHYHCYFNIENEDQFLDESEEIENSEGVTEENLNTLIYGTHTTLMLQGRRNLLSLTSPEWLACIAKGHPERQLCTNVQVRNNTCFLLTAEDDNYLYLKDLCKENNEILKVYKKSTNLPDIRNRKVGESALICELLRYGDAWWQSGLLIENKFDEKTKAYAEDLKKKNEKTNEKGVFNDFMKASDNKHFVFCRSKDDVTDFLAHKMGYQTLEGVEMPPVNAAKGMILMVSPQSGLHIQFQLCECIQSSENPFYDQKVAEEKAISFIVNPNVIPYDLSCILQDKGMLPDASLKSLKGKEHAKEFMKKNAQFLTDYFYHRCREKDLQ